MQNNFVQNVLSVLVPASVGNTSYYNLWNVEKQTTHANTQLCYNSLLPSVIRELNRLPQEMRLLKRILRINWMKTISKLPLISSTARGMNKYTTPDSAFVFEKYHL